MSRSHGIQFSHEKLTNILASVRNQRLMNRGSRERSVTDRPGHGACRSRHIAASEYARHGRILHRSSSQIPAGGTVIRCATELRTKIAGRRGTGSSEDSSEFHDPPVDQRHIGFA
jgi:hypothetical protein